MIPITVYYEIVTHESAEHGEAAESGVDLEDSFSFRELMQWLDRNGPWEASRYPLRDLSGHDWLTSADADINYRTGEHKRLSVHLAHAAPARVRKHWVRAMRHVLERRT